MMLARLVSLHAESAFDHKVICLTDEGPTAEIVRASGVSVWNLAMERGIPNPLAVRRLANRIRSEQAAVVQSWLYHADLVGGIAARLARVPVAWGVHQSTLDPETTPRSLKLTVQACARLSGRVPAAIVLCAEASRTAHIAHGYSDRHMTVIPNGFDVSLFAPDAAARAEIRTELGVAGQQQLIGIAGRFVPLKNHELFVRAVGQVARSHQDARFVMIGEGLDDANPQLATWIGDADLGNRIQLLGRRPDMHRILSALDLYVHTSRTEAFPLVIGEAMATGVPCIATDVGDSAFVIGETGSVVPSENLDALATAINAFLDKPQSERASMGANARARMVSDFDIHTIARRYDDLWMQLIAGESP
jgi:glycosyltransferase involved in cell wall biosynthesis